MKADVIHISWAPATRLGRWSVWLEAASVLMFLINVPVNLYAIRPNDGSKILMAFYVLFVVSMLIAGVAGGIVGIVAVTKRKEHSPLVCISILCGLFMILVIMNEVLQGLQYMLGS